MSNKKIRVIHFLSSLSITSGVAAVIMNYYRNIDRDKVQFDFIYFYENGITYENEINKLGGNIYKISKPGLISNFYKEINNVLKRYDNNYTIFHNHEAYLNIFINKIIKKNNIKSLIVHSHTTLYSDKKISALRNRLLCLPIKKQANYFFACSKAAGETFFGKKYTLNNRVFILNNAINCEKFQYDARVRSDVRKELNIENRFVIGHVGRFNNQKNHKFILKLFNEILKKKNDCKLLLIGDGPLLDDIKLMSKRMNINRNIIFLGRRNDINRILQGMDCFILPSLYEGLPVIGVEAQCSDLPCIMSDNITKEVDVGNCEFLSLDDNINKWVNSVINKEGFKRNDSTESLKNNGFDIRQESLKLRDFYINVIKN